MSPEEIIAAAQRNRARRLDQIRRLRPVAIGARERADQLAQAHGEANGVLQTIKQMETLRFIPNFFPTPRPAIREILSHAHVQPGEDVLEPSAGKADLCRAAREVGANVFAVERVFALAAIVRAAGFPCECADFLEITPRPIYDHVLMNPPFERGIDADHIRHAFEFLKPGGRLVAIASLGTVRRLASWADERDGYTVDLPPNTFRCSDRPTAIATGLVIANKSSNN